MDVDSTVILDESGMLTGIEGERRIQSVMVGGEQLDPEKTYTVASHKYLLRDGGDGNTVFAGCELLLEDTTLDNRVLIEIILRKNWEKL